ncbi:hypothetical protein K9L67_02875 [Candidatus Woesearchaeota archaeon]|nr:hypothetical protein [Candidatus Woesearchaeota archaeon]MCF7901144.1 hypothetical protein [Candidatus Woesearchaeota archaeon]MCF8013679.1 hypothetical protein [Candidatus Woesearchaeota archaeon]
MCCEKCSKMTGALVLIIGIIFLLGNLKVWNFWGIQWYTVAFILGGFTMLGSSCCKECKVSKKK